MGRPFLRKPLVHAPQRRRDHDQRGDRTAHHDQRLSGVRDYDGPQASLRGVNHRDDAHADAEPRRPFAAEAEHRSEDFVGRGIENGRHPHGPQGDEHAGAEQSAGQSQPRFQKLVAAGDAALPHNGWDQPPADDRQHEGKRRQLGENHGAESDHFSGKGQVGQRAGQRGEERQPDQERTHGPAAEQVVVGGFRSARVIPADRQHADEIESDDDDVERFMTTLPAIRRSRQDRREG